MNNIYKIITVAIGVLFLFYFIHLFDELPKINFRDFLLEVNWLYVGISLLAYLLSHALRALRIAILMGRQDYSLLKLVYLQYYTNGINLILPFKLGEVYRIIEFNKIIKDNNKLVLTVIAEKTLDLLVLFIWAILAISFLGNGIVELKIVIWVISALIMFSMGIFFVLPENLKTLNLVIAKRYNTRTVIYILSLTTRILKVISNIKIILKSNFSTISLITLMIWLLEVVGFAYLLPFMAEKVQVWLLSILVFLSSLIPSASLGLGGLQLGFSSLDYKANQFNSLLISLTYQAFIFSPAVLLGLLLHMVVSLNKKSKQRLK